MIGVSTLTVKYRLEIEYIKKREQLPTSRKKKPYETYEKVYQLREQGLTQAKIAERMNLSKATIRTILKNMYEIKGEEYPKIKKAKPKEKQKKKKELDTNEEEIYELCKQGKSPKEIANIMNIPRKLIYRKLQRIYRIKEIENPYKVNKSIKNAEIDKKILEGLSKGKTKKEISEEIGLAQTAISNRINRMKEQGIGISEITKKNDEIYKKILQGLKDGKKQKEIAEELGMAQTSISYRVKKLREQGIEIPQYTIQDDEINKKILKGLSEGKSYGQLAKELWLTSTTISYRVKKMREQKLKTDRNLAKEIIQLIYTKHATIEQVKIIGEYYGVDLEDILNSLELDER